MFEKGKALLSKNNYSQYEVSAYSKPGEQCQHNLNYWLFGDYLGIGPGAHAKITDASQQSVTRYWKHKHPKQYISSNNFIAGQQTLDKADLGFEFLMNALRLNKGFDPEIFQTHTGLAVDFLEQLLEKPLAQQLIDWSTVQSRVNTTEKGKRYLNNLLEMCLLEKDQIS